jgi:SAM-dependent methyltransferase
MDVEELERQLRAFQHSRILLTAIELDIFAALTTPSTAADVARRLSTDPRATELLLNAVTALGFAVKSGGVFSHAPGFGESLSDPRYRTGLLHYVHRWNSWSNLTRRVRGAAPAEEYRELPLEIHESYLAMQDLRSTRRALAVVKAIDDGATAGRVLDLGGGSAPYSIALARRNPRLEADIVELPELLPITARYVAAANLGDRLRVIPGDIHTAEWGTGYDLVLLCSVAHLFGESENRALFQRCHRALRLGGRLAVHDHIMGTDKTAPRQGAVFAINMLVATPFGAAYSFEDYVEWLSAAGFRMIERPETGTDIGLLLATA